MNLERDKFSEIIKDKLNEFEVPYNDAHWAEMNEKLDGANIPSASSGSAINKILWIAAAGVIAVGTWFYLNNEKNDQVNPVAQDELVPANPETKITNSEKSIEEVSEPSQVEIPANNINNTDKQSTEHNTEGLDEKIDKYADYSEQQLKEESKMYVDKIMEEQKSSFDDVPRMDNVELKTDILLTNSKICTGQSVQFKVDREIAGANYYWDFGDKDLKSRKTNPEHIFKKPGVYTVRLNVSKGEIGSKNDWTSELDVTVEKSPDLEIEAEYNQITLNDPYARFQAISDCNCEFKWQFNGNQSSNGKAASFLITERGSYGVSVYAKAANSCEAENTIYYNADKGYKMIVENSFTPNGDGINDDFLPNELKISDVDFLFTVKDLNGQVVYETNDKYDPWNGKQNNTGIELPAGTYLWHVRFTDDRGKVHDQKEKLNLIRR